MGAVRCPYCGRPLNMLREEQQRVGHRIVWMRWLECPRCRHAALDDWALLERENRTAERLREVEADVG
jgi:uncharacterized protein with PIN domain